MVLPWRIRVECRDPGAGRIEVGSAGCGIGRQGASAVVLRLHGRPSRRGRQRFGRSTAAMAADSNQSSCCAESFM